MSRRLRALVPLLALATAAACSGGNNVPVNSSGYGDTAYSGPPAVVVTLQYSSFEPSSVTIHTGETVQWSWQDGAIAHNVQLRAPSGSVLALSPTQTAGRWSYTFSAAGRYPYASTVDARMEGVVVVVVTP